jgi:hypothetical protein
MGSKPKTPDPIKPPPPVAATAKLVDLGSGEEGGASNFEAELKKRQKQKRTSHAGETGGYGGSTSLG